MARRVCVKTFQSSKTFSKTLLTCLDLTIRLYTMNHAPIPLRRLRAAMALKALSVTKVAERAGIPVATTSQILGGRLHDPSRLARLRKVIKEAPMPEEAVAA